MMCGSSAGAIQIRTQLSAGSTGNSRTNWTMWSGRFHGGDGSSGLVAILQSVAISSSVMCGSSAVIRRAGMQHGVCCHRNIDRRSGVIHIRTWLSTGSGSTGNSRTNWTGTGRTQFSAVVPFQKANRHFWQVFKWWVMMGDVFGRDSFARFGDDGGDCMSHGTC